MTRSSASGRGTGIHQAARDFIRDRGGWEAPAADVLKAGKAAGFTDNEIKHARRRCRNPRIASVKSSFGSGWVWQMEPEGATGQIEGAEGATVPRCHGATKVSAPVGLAPSAPWAPTEAEIRRLDMLLPNTAAEVQVAMKATPEHAASLYTWFASNRKRTA